MREAMCEQCDAAKREMRKREESRAMKSERWELFRCLPIAKCAEWKRRVL